MQIMLIVDDLEELADVYRSIAMQSVKCEVVTADGAEAAIKMIGTTLFDVVLTDLKMEKKYEGLDVLRAAKKKDPNTQVIVVSAFGTPEVSVEAMSLGAFDYIQRNSSGIDFFKILPYKIDLALKFRKALLSQARGNVAG